MAGLSDAPGSMLASFSVWFAATVAGPPDFLCGGADNRILWSTYVILRHGLQCRSQMSHTGHEERLAA
jgi:hypothetical protein